MSEKEFNLLHEPWILVMHADGSREMVSLLGAFERAPQFSDLAGELPTQNVAILRLMLAVLHTVFARYAPDGRPSPLRDADGALDRWAAVWNAKSLPMDLIADYLVRHEERFYLFHPEKPFFQVNGLDIATKYTAAKLNGILSESSNKKRLFSLYSGEAKYALSYPEAARWLLYVNGFDDTSAKPWGNKGTGVKMPSTGAGWLGKLGLIYAAGTNLFETLMLNLVLITDDGDVWGDGSPAWERPVKAAERTLIPMPSSQCELLTLQSRRLLLRRDGDNVIGFALLGGDFFPAENAFAEQMTLWRATKEKKDAPPIYLPRRLDPARQMWRDLSAMVVERDGQRIPGVVRFLARLRYEKIIPGANLCFRAAAVHYGDKDFFVDDLLSDSVSFNADLLTAIGADWLPRVLGAVDFADALAYQVGALARHLDLAAGNSDTDASRDAAREQAFFRMDQPFRRWLLEIDPEGDGEAKERATLEWQDQARRIVRALGSELFERSGSAAFVGRMITDRSTKTVRLYAAPKVYNWFIAGTADPMKSMKKG